MSSSFSLSRPRSRSQSSLPLTSASVPLSRADPHHRIFRSSDDNVPYSISSSSNASSNALFHFTSSNQPPERREDAAIGRHGRESSFGIASGTDMDASKDPSPLASKTTFSPSIPPTMRLPSTSDAFQFFPSKASARSGDSFSVPVSDAYMHADELMQSDELAQLHSDAFDDLRRAVAEAGEGFVRRMQEFEACRTGGNPLRVGLNLSSSGTPDFKESYRKRGRKRPSPSFIRCKAQKRFAASSGEHCRSDRNEGSDIEMHSGSESGSDVHPVFSPTKKRVVSVGAPTEGIDVNLQTHLHSLPYPIPLRRGTRSSSSSAYTASSEDECDPVNGIYPENEQHSITVHNLIDTSLSPTSNTPPFSFSSTSNNSSQVSLTTPQVTTSMPPSSFPPQLFNGTPHLPLSTSVIDVSNGRAQKAITELSFALENGSINDYEALRDAHGALAKVDDDAGGLWN